MKIKTKLRRWYYRKNKYINGGRGVISLFLAILMLPFLSIAGMLINAARVDSAVAIFDEALCNASNSTLGTYDDFLKERFGLLAMKQTLGERVTSEDVMEGLSATFDFYLKENMKALSNTYTTYETDVMGIYPLADKNVLTYQILEYSKYRVPAQLLNDSLSMDSLIESFENCLFSDNGAGILGLLTAGLEVGNAFGDMGTNYETLKKEQTTLENNIKSYKSSYTTFETSISDYFDLEDEKETKLSELDPDSETYEEDYAELEAEYDKKIEAQKSVIEGNKTAYVTAIDNLIKQLPKVQTALVKVQGSYGDVSSSIVNMATGVIEQKVATSESSLDENIAKLEKDIANAGDDKTKIEQLTAQLDTLKEQKRNAGNVKTTTSTAAKAYSSGLKEVKAKVNEFNADKYSVVIQDLTALKAVVEGYNCEEITGELDKGTYYKEISGLLTLTEIKNAEKHFVSEITKTSIIGLIRAVINFFDALLNIEIVESKLRAVIDTNYYKSNYGGLPSQKDRSVYPITTNNAEDQKLSDYYKKLFGDYSVEDYVAEYGMDLYTAIEKILGEFSAMKTAIDDFSILTFWEFGSLLKDLYASIKRIIGHVGSIFEYFAYMINGNGILEKTLIAGYANYMFSDRTTYTQSNLDGVSFNLRNQALPKTEAQDIDPTGILTLISASKNTGKAGTEKCFYGAEKEYLLAGYDSEISNQAITFLHIYGIRLICNLPILFNSEVNAIASAATVFGFLVGVLFILIEPLIDTVIIVNGGEVDIVKRYAYMTPSGLKPFFSKITKIQVGKETLNKSKEGLEKAYNTSGIKTTEIKSKKGILAMDYSKIIFLTLCFMPKDKLLDRMADIIEMEAVQNTYKKASANKKFDLDYSYTYIRSEASFTMNEFIPLSNTGGLKSKKRIIYRGY